MPTDGTILLENVPRGKEYLVTALSVFCSFGSVVAALAAIVLIPNNSCEPLPAPCDLDRNLGWKYELAALGVIVCTLLSVSAPLLMVMDKDTNNVHRTDSFLPTSRITTLLGASRTPRRRPRVAPNDLEV
jgi:hypothetical protein